MNAARHNHTPERQMSCFLSLVVPRFYVATYNHIYVWVYAHSHTLKVEENLSVEDKGINGRKRGEKKEEQKYVGCSTVHTRTIA